MECWNAEFHQSTHPSLHNSSTPLRPNVARPSFQDEDSSYYPPRARWYRSFFFNAWRPMRRYINLEKLLAPTRLSLGHICLSLALPGYAFFVLGRRLLGSLVLAGYVIAAMVFLAALGHPAASGGYGLLISLHATGIMFLEAAWLKDFSFRAKVGTALSTLFAVWGLIYAPLVGYAERHWFIPLQVGDRVLIVHPGVEPASIQRGEWLMYEIAGSRLGEHGNNVVLHSGPSVAPVLALPGDRLRFTPEGYFVNDQLFPLAPHMPGGGEWVMPKNVWYIWPHLGMRGYGNVAEGNISAAMQKAAMVTQDQIEGRPFKHWFGRRQQP